MQPDNLHDTRDTHRGPAEFADNWPKELEGHSGDPKEAMGVAPRGFQPFSGANDVDEEELIEHTAEDLEQLEAGPPEASGTGI